MKKDNNRKKHGIGWYIKFVLGGKPLRNTDLKKHTTFGFFVLCLVILFISNTFIAENKLRAIKKAKEIHHIARIKSIEMHTQLKDIIRPSKIYDQMQNLDLEEPQNPPRKIIIKQK